MWIFDYVGVSIPNLCIVQEPTALTMYLSSPKGAGSPCYDVGCFCVNCKKLCPTPKRQEHTGIELMGCRVTGQSSSSSSAI